MNDQAPPCQLYLITPPAFDPAPFADTLAAALDAGPVACVQLRLKDLPRDDVARVAEVLRPVVQSRDVAFIMNDDPGLAADTGCDGVHVGQEDAAYAEARRIVGDDAIVGVTCHDSSDLAVDAAEAGADYVAFGAFYATGTKKPKSSAEPAILEWWSSMTTVPCVAIGGITIDNAPPLIAAGADFLAVVAGVWDHPDGPVAVVRAFNALFANGG